VTDTNDVIFVAVRYCADQRDVIDSIFHHIHSDSISSYVSDVVMQMLIATEPSQGLC
jgi:hypothetical protein